MVIDVAQKIPVMCTFIVEATRRLNEDGFFDDAGTRRASLVVARGELSYFNSLSETGPRKIWVGLAFVGEKLHFHFQRIGDDEATIGGESGWRLPRTPEDLDEATVFVFDRDTDHTGTVQDWEEMVRWVREGVVVDPDYQSKCEERAQRSYVERSLRARSARSKSKLT